MTTHRTGSDHGCVGSQRLHDARARVANVELRRALALLGVPVTEVLDDRGAHPGGDLLGPAAGVGEVAHGGELTNSGSQGSQVFPCHALLRQQLADLSAVLHGRVTPPQKGKGYMYLQGKIQVWDP